MRLGAQVLSPDYSDLASPEERVVRLLSLPLPAHQRLILVGSSMGGYVSTVASRTLKPKGLFLMAPAFYLPGYAEQQPMSGAELTCVVFGRQDEVIPVAHGIRFADENRAELHVIEGDHRLNGQIDRVGELFESFLRRLEVGTWESRFQTPEQVAAVARPFIGRTFHRWFANFESELNKPGCSPNERDLDNCLPKADYGDVQVAFWGGGDLTLTIDTGQAFMGGWPVAGLRLADRSIPQLYAEADVRQPGDRSADRHCRYFPLRWKELIYGDVLREVWVLAGEEAGESEPIPCLCGIALKFAYEEANGERPERWQGPWFLGVSFDPQDEDSWRRTWLRRELPESAAGNAWMRVLA
ncbi:MAG: hypothetical protein Q8K23_14325 [Sulfuritalea sp.]|nr:hypothetical protein [Sulfuritalea sp.]